MTTTMSCSNLSDMKKSQFGFLYRFALKKTAGWTAIYSILLFLCFPLVTFQECTNLVNRFGPDYMDRLSYLMNSQTVSSGLASALMCGMVLVYSAVLYAYMHGRRSSDFFHSMPVDRKVMLLANFSAGFTNLVVPLWVTSVLSAAVYPFILPDMKFMLMWQILGLQAVAWTMGAFILLAISTMVAVCVATAVENVGYTVALLLEGSILLLIWDLSCGMVFDTYISIFNGSGIDNILTNWIYYLSPVFALAQVILNLVNGGAYFFGDVMESTALSRLSQIKWMPLLLWLVLGAGALWLSLKLYEKRQSEKAEQWGRQSWLGFAVKLMSAVIGAWLFAVTIGDMLGIDSRFAYTFGALTGAPLTYLIIEAITNKGFTNMKKCLPYLGGAVATVLIFSIYFAVDGFGYDERVPDVEQIKTVELELNTYAPAVKWNDVYAMTYSKELEQEDLTPYRIEGYETENLILLQPASIETVTELHKGTLDSKGEYMTNITVGYEQGLLDTRRSLNVRYSSVDSLLELMHSDEYLENYDALFELKGAYLEFVQICDKLGTPIGEGEIEPKHFDELIEALRADMRNRTPETLRDSSNNPEVAELHIRTKYPKEIYDSSAELYHYDMQQRYAVRKMDSNTIKLLESWGYELNVQDGSFEDVLGLSVHRSYRDGNLPGIPRGNNSYSVYYNKHDLSDKYSPNGGLLIRDEKWIRTLAEESSSIYNGYGDQYFMEIYRDAGTEVHSSLLYVDRKLVAEMMVERNRFNAPYILSNEEWELLQKDIQEESKSEVALMEENISWQDYVDGKHEGKVEYISMLDYCKEKHPEILEGKSDSELICMSKTPLYGSEYGSFVHLYW